MEKFTQQDIDSVLNLAINKVKIPHHLKDWKDEIRGAGVVGITQCLMSGNSPAPRALLINAAFRDMIDELRKESVRRGLTKNP